MRLMHWTDVPLGPLRDMTHEQDINMFKPRGLWVSDESGNYGWSDWCQAEGMDWLHPNVYEVDLVSGANVLRITTLGEIDRFHVEWKIELGWRTMIQWPLVATHYDGIIISPYQWSRRLDGAVSDWYYSWDCASGCIWNPRAIAEVRPATFALGGAE